MYRSSDLMMKIFSGNKKYIFPRFQLYARAYKRIWRLRSCQDCSLKMAGYWPSSIFSFCVHIKTQKNDEANIHLSRPNKFGQGRIYYIAKENV